MRLCKLTNDDVNNLINWYQANKRDLPWRRNNDAYRVWISEIMAQQTRISAVIPYFNRFISAVPDIESLAALPTDSLLKLWEGLGYYSRAKNLQKAAVEICNIHNKSFPNSFEEILKLPGIGEYTASAIASISFHLPYPVVDGNVLRVMCRFENNHSDIALADTKKHYFSALKEVIPTNNPGDFNQAIMELGALVCVPNGIPKCSVCPLSKNCLAHLNQNWDMLPVKSSKSPRKTENYTVVIVNRNIEILLQKRKPTGLLADLYQYCILDGHLNETDVNLWLTNHNLHPIIIKQLPDSKHIFTHKEWQMKAFMVNLPADCKAIAGYQFVPIQNLADTYPLPSAFKIYTDIVKESEK